MFNQGGGSYHVSVGRDVPPKGVQFSKSFWNGGIFHCTNSGKGAEIYLSGKGSMLVKTGVVTVII